MPRKITIYLECDWELCTAVGDEGTDVVIERTVALDKQQPKIFLLCKEHSDALDEILMPLLQAGEKVPVKKKGSSTNGGASSGSDASAGSGGNGHPREEIPCQEADCSRILHNRTGMAQHAIRTHGYPDLASYEQAHGLVA